MAIMKTFSTKILIFAMAIFTLVSCSDDQELAYYLDGYWEGLITDANDEYSVTIEFVQRNGFAKSGWGYEKDCSYTGHRSKVKFDWEVRDRLIYLRYHDGTSFVYECDWFPRNGRIGDNFKGIIYNEPYKERVANFYLYKRFNHDDNDYYYNKQDSVVVIDNKNNVEPNQNELK
jgi:hypothetical protein